MTKITYKQSNYNILTFGSCLSRFSALAISKLYSANVICTIFNNRTDLFIKNILNNYDLTISLEDLKKYIELSKDGERFFLRQKRDFIGIYNPLNPSTKQKNLWDCIKNETIDLIIIDNYMDIVARSVYIDTCDNKNDAERFFLPKSNTLNQEKLVIENYLDINESIKNFIFLSQFFHNNFPNSKIVFLNFPYDTYPDGSSSKKRFISFNKRFISSFNKRFNPIDLSIELRIFDKSLETEDKQHFSENFYYGVAGNICSIL